MEEKLVSAEPLTMRPLKSKELLGIFVFTVENGGGSCPSYIPMLQEGLRAASEKLPSLGIFVGPEGEMNLSKELKSAFENKSFEGHLNEEWKQIHISDPAKRKIAIRMEEVLTPQGRKALEEAAKAAKKVWLERAI